MRRFRFCLGMVWGVLALLSNGTANGAEQIRPRILIIFDTSTSMLLDINSPDDPLTPDVNEEVYTFGDGSWDPWDPAGGTNPTRGCCPGTGGSRMFASKEAMRQMVKATGDIEFALMKFAQEYAPETANGWTDDSDDVPIIDYIKYMNNQNESGDDRMRYRSYWFNGECFPAFAPVGDALDYQWLAVEFPLFGADNRDEILMWMNHHEFKSDGSGDPAESALSRVDDYEQELRAAGATPLADSMIAAEQYLESVYADDYDTNPVQAACRPYSVVLLTDGDEFCGGDVTSGATGLHYLEDSGTTDKEVKIYVIGLNLESNDLHDIASIGGTGSAFSANSQVDLSENLYDIIEDSILVETCNQLDDDCDGEIDEDFRPNRTYCNTGPTCTFPHDGQAEETADILCVKPTECACDGIDNNCDGQTDEPPNGQSWPTGGVCGGCVNEAGGRDYCDDPAEGRCEQGQLVCEPGTGYTCVGSIDPTEESCNNLDDDCDGVTDEDIFGDDCGLCGDGQWRCVAGEMTCCRADVTDACELARSPEAERCNNIDDDCDGETDEDVVELCGGCDEEYCADPGAGVCSQGLAVCEDGEITSCDGEIGPQAESCNNQDDDCDGETDEEIEALPCGQCSDNTWICIDGAEQCCNGIDGDGNCIPARGPSAETCNNIDDDCDGETDEDVPFKSCMDSEHTDKIGIGICNNGYLACQDGVYGNINPESDTFEAGYCKGQQLPKSETCNGLDDDCDGDTDEDVDTQTGCGPCKDGEEQCVDGILQCVGAREPGVEICNDADDDCDGYTDENLSRICMSDEFEDKDGVGICHSGIETCQDGAWGYGENGLDWEADACGNQQLPEPEQCDCLDNDCDGETDEDLPSPVGETCSACGVWICENCELVCSGGTNAESCDGLDNNCNGLTDEGIQDPCGGCVMDETTADLDPLLLEDCLDAQEAGLVNAGAGECQEGVKLCDHEAPDKRTACQGFIPPSVERCDGKDNDCDGLTDEEEDIEQVNDTCSASEGLCEAARWYCMEDEAGDKALQCCQSITEEGVCVPPTAPSVEICNGLDDDCDGQTDEDLANAGVPCGLDLGACEPGYMQCVCDEEGACDLACVGETKGSDEVCNGVDDDCDGQTDEELPIGPTCTNAPGGEPMGECDEGHEQCISGEWGCNAVRPSDEICDGLDNDCDGLTDENLAVECPENSWCIEGACAPACAGEELACPAYSECVETKSVTGATIRVCVADVCSPGTENALPCVDNPYYCDDGHEPMCKCSPAQKKCISICSDIICPDGHVCVPSTGHCEAIEKDCYAAGCPLGEVCREGKCVDNPCATSCDEGEYCNKDGKCVKPCVDLDCPGLCFEGECVDRCDGVSCESGEHCNLLTGKCEAQDVCQNVSCKFYEVCQGGSCIEDPCWGIDCPNGMKCEYGTCMAYGSTINLPDNNNKENADSDENGDTDGSTDLDEAEIPNTFGMSDVLATGAGGCMCNSTPGRSSSLGAVYLVLFGIGLVLLRLGYHRKHLLVPILWVLGSLFLLGCTTDPYHLNQIDEAMTNSDEGMDTEASTDTEEIKEVDTAACGTETSGDESVCDGVDNDCDGEIDEDVNFESVENCGECGNDCRLIYANAFGICEEGACAMGDCLPFYGDLNDDASDGCEYFCQKRADKDGCNGVDLGDYVGVDDDCDGQTDEDVDLMSDKYNCGRCGNVCVVPHAEALCVEGECTFEACDGQFYDVDGVVENGCEYTCKPDGEEQCNGVDDDCDGKIDENSLGDGEPCYTLSNGCNKNDDGEIVCNGRCQAGTMRCRGGSFVCEDQVTPLPTESCNNIDDNCDGKTDEGLSRSCDSTNEEDTGVCLKGYQLCVEGEWGPCTGEVYASAERCDGRDNDCDGKTDEDLTDMGEVCGGGPDAAAPEKGICKQGISACVDGDVVCEGEVPPSKEICDGLDNDCDGLTDENITEVCGGCDSGLYAYCTDANAGLCQAGVRKCIGGEFGECVASISPKEEVCDGFDNDCDGTTDLDENGAPVTGNACGTCGGIEHCINSQSVCCLYLDENGDCVEPRDPTMETCNNIDDDCDGETDNIVQVLCDGDDADQCAEGVAICVDGADACSDDSGDSVEVCDGLDNDCDGETDEGLTEPPAGWCNTDCGAGFLGAVCNGTSGWSCEYACATGEAHEVGEVQCNSQNQVVASESWCNGMDDDCDGVTDENLSVTVESCGSCGNNCWDLVPADGHVASLACIGGTCLINACDDGYYDIDGNAASLDCEYSCTYDGDEGAACDGVDNNCDGLTDNGVATAETCDGLDNNCDGETDEGMTLPDICNPRCPNPDTHAAQCYGEDGWRCNYACISEGGSVDCVDEYTIADTETLCDGLDNNCDGTVDEGFTLWGTASVVGAKCESAGEGGCKQEGTVTCSADKLSLVCCASPNGSGCDVVIPQNPSPGTEADVPNGVDEDCDGLTDDGANNCIDTVTISGMVGQGSFEMFQYEASRYDASSSNVGASAPCSKPNVLPWTNVTFEEARAACLRLNEAPSGSNCDNVDPDDNGSGCWDLCDANQWYYACAYGDSTQSAFPYGDSYAGGTCNGTDYGDPDSLIAAGVADTCVASWDSDVYDLSGNAQEWTREELGDLRIIRGGSYKDVADTLRCDYPYFGGAATEFQMDQIGFRCCRGSAPIANCALAIDHLPNHGYDFDSGTLCTTDGFLLKGEFEVGNYTGGTPSVSSCIIGTDLDGQYDNDTRSSAVSPMIDLSACSNAADGVRLTWDMYLDRRNNDELRLLVSSDGGTTWYRMATFDSDTSGWESFTQDVTTYAVTNQFQFRFIMDSDDADRNPGAYIDNIRLEHYTDSMTPATGQEDSDVEDDEVDEGPQCGTSLPAVLRDFSDDHPDFQVYSGTSICFGMLENNLDDNGKPKLNVGYDCATGEQNSSEASFNQWYAEGHIHTFTETLDLEDVDGDGIYTFPGDGNGADFFPLDDLGYGNEGRDNNFHFTTEINTYFMFLPPQTFEFTGDDDLWVFINGVLVVDVGGLHPARYGRVTLNADGTAFSEYDNNGANADGIDTQYNTTVNLGLIPGYIYSLDVFHAERHTNQSNFRIDTNLCLQNVD